MIETTPSEDRKSHATTPGGLILRWVAGFALATIGIWVIGAFTLDTPLVYVWDDAVQRYVVRPGDYIKRTEGIASTRTGLFGINAIDDIREVDGKLVAVWGDSYVDARHVEDALKMPQVFTRLWNQDHADTPVTAVGIAMESWSLADICDQMPRYEALAGPFAAHFILIAHPEDVDFDQVGRTARFVRDSEPAVESLQWRPPYQSLKLAVGRTDAYFVWPILKDLAGMGSLRFAPGHVSATISRSPRTETVVHALPAERLAGWRATLGYLRRTTESPIFIVYAPPVPGLSGSKVHTNDPFATEAKALNRITSEMGIGFISLRDAFAATTQTHGRFPRGFPNTVVYAGHFNDLGHRIVAEAMVQALTEQYALHAD